MSLRKLLALCVLAGVVLCIAVPVPAHDGRKITVAVNSNWPPMEMKDDAGKIVGYEIDLMNAIASEVGLDVDYVDVSWRKIFSQLDEGRFDAVVASVSITDGRRERYDFSDPYFTAEQVFVVRKAMAGAPLYGKTMAAFKLTTGAEAIRLYQKCNITFYTVEETDRAFSDLSRGFIDGILCDAPLAASYAEHNRKYEGMFTLREATPPEGCPAPREDYGIVVKKGNADLLALINQGLQAVRGKGIEDALRRKWIPDPAPDTREALIQTSSPPEIP